MAKFTDTVQGTFAVVIGLCLLCAIFVAGSAVALKPLQLANAAQAKQQSIMNIVGIDTKGQDIAALYEQRVKSFTYNVNSHELVARESLNDVYSAVEDAAGQDVSALGTTAGIRGLTELLPVFEVTKEDGSADAYVVDVRGAGLWGTMYAFVAIEPNGETIRNIYFYNHSETPGLGGEIQNPRWTAQFQGKQAVNSQGDVVITVTKNADPNKGEVDGLSGASLTSKGVDNTLKFWLSDEGYGQFFAQLRQGGAQ